jgi:hypothetical protein
MSISRRIFIQMASVAAIAAGTVSKPNVLALVQDPTKPVDPLALYTQSTFTQYINSIFRLHGLSAVEVTLEKVQDTLGTKESREGGRESFVLHFRGGRDELPQNTYTVDHPALGTFKLFLVPSGADKNGAQGYTATINRLSYSFKPTSFPKAAPRKPTPSTPESEAPETRKPLVQPRERKSDPERSSEYDIQ